MRPPTDISSRDNPRFKSLKALWTAKGIGKAGQSLVSGRKLVEEALKNRDVVPVAVIGRTDEPLADSVLAAAAARDCEIWRLAPALLREVDLLATGQPLLVVSVPAFAVWPEPGPAADGPAVVLPLQNPDNLGAAVRSAVAFGVSRIILTAESAHPFLPKCIRAAAGAVFGARFVVAGRLADLPVDPARARVLDGGGQPLAAAPLPRDMILVVGVEGQGVPATMGGLTRIAIPIEDRVESLNATVALGIALFHWRLIR